MRRLPLTILLNLLCVVSVFASGDEISILSWNLRDFGQSRSDSEITFIAKTVKYYDIIAIQEVVAKDPGGAQAVARLADALNRMGSKWDYRISDPTTGSSYKSERYAFIWKTSRAKIVGRPWLEQKYKMEMDREPYYATFEVNGKHFTLCNFHAITASKHPETEIIFLGEVAKQQPNLKLIFLGDFNLSSTHSVFSGLKKIGYAPAFIGQKTTLKEKCVDNQCLASEFDNFFIPSNSFQISRKQAIHFYMDVMPGTAHDISDHIPITVFVQLL